jgi:hypothetical protein
MKISKILFLITLVVGLNNDVVAQDPSAPVWGLYASGVGERLRPGMDPCWITYTVGLVSDPQIQINLVNGLMGVILTGISWYDATAAQRLYSRYFEDRPDGIYKLTPCEVSLPNVTGSWFSPGRGRMNLTQTGNKITGSANGINPGDHFGQGHRNGGSISGYVANDGTIVLQDYWNDGTFTEEFWRISEDGKTTSSNWNWYTDSSKTSSKGSGTYSLQRE